MLESKSPLSRAEFAVLFLVGMGLTYTVSMISPFLAFFPFAREFLYILLYGYLMGVLYFRIKPQRRLWVLAMPVLAFIAELFPILLLVPTILMVVGFTFGLQEPKDTE